MKTKFAWFPVIGVYDTGHRMYNAIFWLQKYEQRREFREAKRIGLFSYRGRCFSVGRLYSD